MYEAARQGLGDEFLAAVRTALDRIVESPRQYPIIHRQTRRVLIFSLPYSLLYRVIGQRIVVIACFQGRRNPRIWRSRR